MNSNKLSFWIFQTSIVIIVFGIIWIAPACNTKGKKSINPNQEHKEQSEEAEEMIALLKEIANSQDTLAHYHQNKKLAAYYQLRIKKGTPQQQVNTWFEFCKQLLYAGDSQMCIDEIEAYLSQRKLAYSELLNESTKSMFDLLALAYLRIGEQENCQNNHSSGVCILPLNKAAIHQLKTGSEKAAELYGLLYEKFPDDHRYKWLLNLAKMTLGEYPQSLSKEELIPFPNWELEQSNFPQFKQVAMKRGVAVNGLSGGSILEDFNNDGHLDLFVTSYGLGDQVKLFINDARGKFEDKTIGAQLGGIVSGLNCMQADYNNDGFLDILILRGGWLEQGGKHPNSLLKNNGDGTFSDVTQSSGLLSYHPAQTAAWADVNRDGYLDLFIGNESMKEDPNPCEFFINNGNGTFTEAAKEFGLDIKAYVKGVVFGDFNNDLWPDLYVSILGQKNLLFKNVKGQFVELAEKAGVQKPIFSFPTFFFDVNNDGYQDLLVSSYDVRYFNQLAGDYARELQGMPVRGEKLQLYMNNGDETFSEKSEEYGIDKTIYSMGCNFGDLDNDGWLDFYLGTGAPDFSTVVPNRMFRNVNGTHFEEVTSAGNFGHIQKGHGVAFGDIDSDGYQDIYAVLGGAYEGDVFHNVLYENPGFQNNWISLDLVGKETNHSAIGSKVEVFLDNGQKLYRVVSSGGSFGASSLRQEIGLASANRIDSIMVYWQKGDTTVERNLSVNQKLIISE